MMGGQSLPGGFASSSLQLAFAEQWEWEERTWGRGKAWGRGEHLVDASVWLCAQRHMCKRISTHVDLYM